MKANKKGKIIIRYQNIDRKNFSDLPFEHNQELAYTKKNLDFIIKTALSGIYSILIRPTTYLGLTVNTDHLTVYIGIGKMGC